MPPTLKTIIEEEEDPLAIPLMEKVKNFIILSLKVIKVLIIVTVVLFVMLLGLAFLSTDRLIEQYTVSSGEDEWASLLEREEDASITDMERTLLPAISATLNCMKQGSFSLTKSAARDFGKTIFTADNNAVIRSITFYIGSKDEKRAVIEYNIKISKKVTLTVTQNQVKKVLTRDDSLASLPFSFFLWNTYYRFWEGFRRYEYTASISDFNTYYLGNQEIKVQSVRQIPLGKLMRLFTG